MILSIVCVAAVVLLIFLYQFVKLQRAVKQNHAPAPAAANLELLVELHSDDDNIHAKYPDGSAISIKWSALTAVGVRSTGDKSGQSATYWGLHTGKRLPDISYPQGAIGDKELLAEFAKRLPGFDMAKVMKAVASSDNAHFQIWQKK